MLISRGCPWAIIQEGGLNLEKKKGCGCSFAALKGSVNPGTLLWLLLLLKKIDFAISKVPIFFVGQQTTHILSSESDNRSNVFHSPVVDMPLVLPFL